jgi:hypothetical protein
MEMTMEKGVKEGEEEADIKKNKFMFFSWMQKRFGMVILLSSPLGVCMRD